MIRHILLVRFKADASARAIEDLRVAFEAMPSLVEGVAAVEWGENDSPENKNKGYTHCIMMTFADEKGRDNYLPHPEHNALKTLFRPVLEDIIVLDYSL